MVRKLNQLLYNPICLSCGSYFVLDHLFCGKCYQFKLLPRARLQQKFSEVNLSSFHFIDWIPGESDLVSEMVYRFKSSKCVSAWEHYADLIFSELTKKIETQDIDYIVPIPGSKRSSVHSQIFARIAQKFLQKPVLDVLKKSAIDSSLIEQKRRSKTERTKISIEVCELITQNLNDLGLESKHVLVVDDILTSGNSFRQAIKALGPVKKATLVTLFHRHPKVDADLVS